MPPTAKKPEPAAGILAEYPDHALCAATEHLHREQGLKNVKATANDLVGVNHKGQTVVTSRARAAAHARFLDENPDAYDGPAPKAPAGGPGPVDPYLPDSAANQ